MPQSLSNILVHLVFSTKDRVPLLEDAWRDHLHGYVGGIIRRCDGDLIAANSVADHIHLLFALPRTMAVADLVREIKTGATKWIHEREHRLVGFHWQAGYGVFSVSPGHKQAVIAYIATQAEHHRTVSFRDEYLRLLEKYQIKYDEHYVWD
jgi:REP element-mobilizing transposase RayT